MFGRQRSDSHIVYSVKSSLVIIIVCDVCKANFDVHSKVDVMYKCL